MVGKQQLLCVLQRANCAVSELLMMSLYTLQVVILVEVLPISATSLCAISWVPASMTVQTPKLMIKPLVSSQPPATTHTERSKGPLQKQMSGLVRE